MERVRRLLLLVALVAVPVAVAAPVPFAPPDEPPSLPTLAQQRTAVARAAALGKPVYCGGSAGNAVALTFDDGPGPYTEQVLDDLRAAGARATFFLVGNRVAEWPDAARDETYLGAVGDHSWSHPRLTELPRWDVYLELERTRDSVRGAAGRTPTLWRSPYELHDASVDGVAKQLGLLQVLWSVTSGDDQLHPTATSVARNVIRGLRPGAIVLMHDIHPWTAAALPRILKAVAARHLRAVSVPELLALDSPSGGCAFVSAGPGD
jgi:peptidoglycan/xylan/chitin deacetylase (PgdA/CDA1 family)